MTLFWLKFTCSIPANFSHTITSQNYTYVGSFCTSTESICYGGPVMLVIYGVLILCWYMTHFFLLIAFIEWRDPNFCSDMCAVGQHPPKLDSLCSASCRPCFLDLTSSPPWSLVAMTESCEGMAPRALYQHGSVPSRHTMTTTVCLPWSTSHSQRRFVHSADLILVLQKFWFVSCRSHRHCRSVVVAFECGCLGMYKVLDCVV